MRVDRVRVAFGSTVNTGNFNSLRFDVEFEAQLEPADDAIETVRFLHDQASAEVKRQASARVKGPAKEGAA